jgi:two-component system, chemotaxis family, response regulator Rcp1
MAKACSSVILLVDDNPGDARLVREAWRDSGQDRAVHHVQDGHEAIDFLRAHGAHQGAPRPDLILLDLNLPRKHGREVLAEIKADDRLRRIPVVVFTTAQSEEDIQAAYNLKANCCVPKPGDLDQFQKVVRSIGDFWLSVAELPVVSE